MPADILCIGHAAWDLTYFLDRFPAEDTKNETDTRTECGGGPAANAAWLLSRWGNRCAFAGRVGDDLFGRQIAQEFRDAGTDVSLLELSGDFATPVSSILVSRATGSRTIATHMPAGARFRFDRAGLLAMRPKLMLFDGHEADASLAALDAFPGATTVLDAGSVRPGTLALAPRVDYLAASEKFARQLTGMDLASDEGRRRCVGELRSRFGRTVVVTLGEAGLVADDGTGFWHLPAYPASAMDTTAAGDIFHGAFAHAIAHGQALRDALKLGAMAAALSVQVRGGRTSVPALGQVEAALARAG